MVDTSHFIRPIGRRNQEQLLSDINVTPMVDVMLVLLIIFMVTGQMIAAGTEVDLPDASADALETDMEALQISVDAQQKIYIDDILVAPEAFASTLAELAMASGAPQEQMVFVRADRSLPYGIVMETVSQIAEAGFSKVAFVSDPAASPVAAGAL